MANITTSLAAVMKLPGSVGAVVIDLLSGRILGQSSVGVLNLAAASGNAEVVRAKMRLLHDLELSDYVTDVLITIDTQYHIIHPIDGEFAPAFLYVALDKSSSELDSAREEIAQIAASITI